MKEKIYQSLALDIKSLISKFPFLPQVSQSSKVTKQKILNTLQTQHSPKIPKSLQQNPTSVKGFLVSVILVVAVAVLVCNKLQEHAVLMKLISINPIMHSISNEGLHLHLVHKFSEIQTTIFPFSDWVRNWWQGLLMKTPEGSNEQMLLYGKEVLILGPSKPNIH